MDNSRIQLPRPAAMVQEQLTAKGEHRSAGPVDLLVAAAAEEAGLTLLHYDHDVELPVAQGDLRLHPRRIVELCLGGRRLGS